MQVSSNMEEDKLSVMRATGSSVVMDCDLTGSYIHWYKFQDGAVPRRLLHYIVSNSKVVLDSGISEGKYHVYKGTGKSYTFVISNLQESDSGTYYCAVWEKHIGLDFLYTALEILLVAAKTALIHRIGQPLSHFLPPIPFTLNEEKS